MFCCRGEVQLGVPDPWYYWDGPDKAVACKHFLFTEGSLVIKIKKTFLILLSQLK